MMYTGMSVNVVVDICPYLTTHPFLHVYALYDNTVLLNIPIVPS